MRLSTLYILSVRNKVYDYCIFCYRTGQRTCGICRCNTRNWGFLLYIYLVLCWEDSYVMSVSVGEWYVINKNLYELKQITGVLFVLFYVGLWWQCFYTSKLENFVQLRTVVDVYDVIVFNKISPLLILSPLFIIRKC